MPPGQLRQRGPGCTLAGMRVSASVSALSMAMSRAWWRSLPVMSRVEAARRTIDAVADPVVQLATAVGRAALAPAMHRAQQRPARLRKEPALPRA